ncbi:hypothetical protein IW262DRAFT_1295349 [Armillaria fumosa]|nr:hypothetical protein IW262DRAFT_1295349 [Armillaria fumosa]
MVGLVINVELNALLRDSFSEYYQGKVRGFGLHYDERTKGILVGYSRCKVSCESQGQHNAPSILERKALIRGVGAKGGRDGNAKVTTLSSAVTKITPVYIPQWTYSHHVICDAYRASSHRRREREMTGGVLMDRVKWGDRQFKIGLSQMTVNIEVGLLDAQNASTTNKGRPTRSLPVPLSLSTINQGEQRRIEVKSAYATNSTGWLQSLCRSDCRSADGGAPNAVTATSARRVTASHPTDVQQTEGGKCGCAISLPDFKIPSRRWGIELMWYMAILLRACAASVGKDLAMSGLIVELGFGFGLAGPLTDLKELLGEMNKTMSAYIFVSADDEVYNSLETIHAKTVLRYPDHIA